MGEDNLEEFDHAIAGEAPLRAFLESVRPQLLGADARQLTMMLESLLPEIDRATLRDPAFGAETVAMFAEGLREGVDGWVDDDLAFVKPWGFALADIASPVTLWQGDVDLMVPFAHGQWLAGAIPGADVHLLPGEGHLSVAVGSAEAMLDALLALA